MQPAPVAVAACSTASAAMMTIEESTERARGSTRRMRAVCKKSLVFNEMPTNYCLFLFELLTRARGCIHRLIPVLFSSSSLAIAEREVWTRDAKSRSLRRS